MIGTTGELRFTEISGHFRFLDWSAQFACLSANELELNLKRGHIPESIHTSFKMYDALSL